MIKLVATDIDGTILGESGEFTPGVKNCIKTMQEKGIKVVIVTGRMFAAAKQIAKRLNLTTPVVAYQGGMIKKSAESDEVLYDACIPVDDVKQIIRWARGNNIHLNLYSNDILYVEEDNPTIQQYASRQNLDYKIEPFDDIELSHVNKLLAIDYTDAEKVTGWINERRKAMPHLYIVKSTPHFCEFSTPQATKACAIRVLKKYWNLKDDEVVAIEGITDEEYITVFTNKNTSKRVKTTELEETGRAKRGNSLIKKIKSSPYEITNVLMTSSKTDVTLITEDGKKELKNSEIPIMDLQSTGSTISKKEVLASLKTVEIEKKEIKASPKEEQQTFELNDFKL